MDRVPLNVHYDADMDVFSAWTRQPAEVLCIEPVEGVVIRVDAATDETVGYTIVDCAKRFAAIDPSEITLPVLSPAALLPLRNHLRFLASIKDAAA